MAQHRQKEVSLSSEGTPNVRKGTRPMNNGQPPTPSSDSIAPSRLGLGLFAVYVLLYGGFMALVLFWPDLLTIRLVGGINLAIAAGLGLIVAAVVLSVVYMVARSE